MAEVKSANKLFLRWLREWYQDASDKDSKMRFVYKKAIKSLSSYPPPITDVHALKQLQNFGVKLCKSLGEKLQQYLDEGNTLPTHSVNPVKKATPPIPKTSAKQRPISKSNRPSKTQTKQPLKKKADTARQRRADRKTSVEPDDDNANQDLASTSSDEILFSTGIDQSSGRKHRNTARKSCPINLDDSYTSLKYWYIDENKNTVMARKKSKLIFNDAGQKLYTIKTTSSQLVSSKVKYQLDENQDQSNDSEFIIAYLHHDYAGELCNPPRELCNLPRDSTYDSRAVEFGSRETTTSSRKCAFKLQPDDYRICLCVDNQEMSGRSTTIDFGGFFDTCDFIYDKRKLHLGDFLWVAKDKNSDRELVIDCIVERKSMDDLGSSIKDGRYHEQKFRLGKCEMNKIFYVAENSNSSGVGIPISRLHQAILNTRVVDDFAVWVTQSWKETAEFIAALTKSLQHMYRGKTLYCAADQCDVAYADDYLPTFEMFNKRFVKNKKMTVKEAFVKLLLPISGASPDKAFAIVNVYPTVNHLLTKYEECEKEDDKIRLLANIRYGSKNRLQISFL
ncbi:Crossover junction endonuclease MUS81 [Trichoplax sp. H2]|nr:Crossover junction endonuclease MUS81 [Trichoplax sp. H2]|eukprot:RDD42564.1 Crossover junction endonuclease MUS81 [Trichoplax sp. H2]